MVFKKKRNKAGKVQMFLNLAKGGIDISREGIALQGREDHEQRHDSLREVRVA